MLPKLSNEKNNNTYIIFKSKYNFSILALQHDGLHHSTYIEILNQILEECDIISF